MNPDDVVVGVVALNGGELVGRTRLQKTAFLLERCGMASGVPFHYYHYGPFSVELARGWDEAATEGRLDMRDQPGEYETPYTVFASTQSETPAKLGNLDAEQVRRFLTIMREYTDIVVELAATIVYLRERGHGDKALEEVKARKPLKATPERVERAVLLLRELELN
jgi:uncharacterized protein YwgA